MFLIISNERKRVSVKCLGTEIAHDTLMNISISIFFSPGSVTLRGRHWSSTQSSTSCTVMTWSVQTACCMEMLPHRLGWCGSLGMSCCLSMCAVYRQLDRDREEMDREKCDQDVWNICSFDVIPRNRH